MTKIDCIKICNCCNNSCDELYEAHYTSETDTIYVCDECISKEPYIELQAR